jgi:hypothetical protein
VGLCLNVSARVSSLEVIAEAGEQVRVAGAWRPLLIARLPSHQGACTVISRGRIARGVEDTVAMQDLRWHCLDGNIDVPWFWRQQQQSRDAYEPPSQPWSLMDSRNGNTTDARRCGGCESSDRVKSVDGME